MTPSPSFVPRMLLVAILLNGCVSKETHRKLLQEIDTLNTEVESSNEKLKELQKKVKDEKKSSPVEISKVRSDWDKQIQEATRKLEEAEKNLAAAIAEKQRREEASRPPVAEPAPNPGGQ